MDEEEAIAWQDVLDEIAAGRGGNLSCPFCGQTPLAVTERGNITRIACSGCGKYIEGAFKQY